MCHIKRGQLCSSPPKSDQLNDKDPKDTEEREGQRIGLLSGHEPMRSYLYLAATHIFLPCWTKARRRQLANRRGQQVDEGCCNLFRHNEVRD